LKPILVTPRLALRAARRDDAAHLLALDRDPEVRRFVDQPEEPTLALMEAAIGRVLAIDASDPRVGFWMAEFEGRFAGWFHMKPPREGDPAEPGDMELGYRLHRHLWGRGLATEGSREMLRYAFAELAVPRVIACAMVENRASTRVMEKLGMQLWRRWTGKRRAGTEWSAVTYALAR
jgi:RimJ/RimL family protein N-acetyltransferase